MNLSNQILVGWDGGFNLKHEDTHCF